MNETYKIRNVGGSLMVVLPQQVARVLSLKAGDDVSISIVSIGAGGDVLIKPVRPKKLKGRSK
jgi:antitoxin component of MazEF toxin-antitoxin module